jgi:hypothetical protein
MIVFDKIFSHLLAESIFILFYSTSFSLLLPFVLGSGNFTLYALGLTYVSLYSFLSLGTSVLVPTTFALGIDSELVVLASLKIQILVLALFTLILLYSGLGFLGSLLYGINSGRLLIISSGLMFAGQILDDTVHVYLRMSGQQRRSLLFSIYSKLAIAGFFLAVIKFSRNGEIVFSAMSVLVLLSGFIKIAMNFPVNKIVTLKGVRSSWKILRFNYVSLWVGGASNTIYNGIMRLWLGKFVGIEILPLLTIASQVAGAFSSLTGSITFNLVNHYNLEKKKIVFDLIAYKKATILALLSSIACFFATIVVLAALYYGKLELLVGSSIAIPSLAVIALGQSFNVISIPRFQMAQLLGSVNMISFSNLLLAAAGLLSFYVLEDFGANSLTLLVTYSAVAIVSPLLVVAFSRSSAVARLM